MENAGTGRKEGWSVGGTGQSDEVVKECQRAQEGAKALCELAAELGYHVINLMYPEDIPATVCAGDGNPGALALRSALSRKVDVFC